jgi:hypothetical protein
MPNPLCAIAGEDGLYVMMVPMWADNVLTNPRNITSFIVLKYKVWLFKNLVTKQMVTSERAVLDKHYFPGNKLDLLKCCPKGPTSAFVDLSPATPLVVDNDRGDDEDNLGVH